MREDVGEAEEFVTVAETEVPELERLAAQQGVRVELLATRAIDPLSTLTAVLVGSSLAVSTVMRLLDEWRGGQVIDLRPGAAPLAYRTRDLMYGLIIIRTQDGTVQVERLDVRTAHSELVGLVARIAVGDGKEDTGAAAVRSRLEQQLPAGHARVDTPPQPDVES